VYGCRDEDWGFQLYQSDPSGNYGGWKATAIGANKQAAQNLLKQDYEEDITLEKAIKLVIKVSLSRDVLLLVVYLLRTIKLVLRLTPRMLQAPYIPRVLLFRGPSSSPSRYLHLVEAPYLSSV